jgi:hypothetical protein
MTKTDNPLPESGGLREHLIFVALLIPTFVVIAAAAVSLARPDPSVAVSAPAQIAAACEPCPVADNGDDGP